MRSIRERKRWLQRVSYRSGASRRLPLTAMIILICLGSILFQRSLRQKIHDLLLPPLTTGEKDAIRVTVFKDLIANSRVDSEVAFVSIEEGRRSIDPPPAMIRVLAAPGIPVEPGTRAVTGVGRFRDRMSGARGVLFTTGDIRLVNRDTVDVEGEGVANGREGGGGNFRVIRRNGRWQVIHYTMKYII